MRRRSGQSGLSGGRMVGQVITGGTLTREVVRRRVEGDRGGEFQGLLRCAQWCCGAFCWCLVDVKSVLGMHLNQECYDACCAKNGTCRLASAPVARVSSSSGTPDQTTCLDLLLRTSSC